MCKTKQELEQRIKELEQLIEHLNGVIYEKNCWINQIQIQQIPLECIHDWQYNYSTTSPNRTCKKCWKFEFIITTYGTFNTKYLLSNSNPLT